MPAVEAQEIVASKIPRRVESNIDQRGLKFYVERYLLNHPDSPQTPKLMQLYFGDGDAMRSVMIAVGLAGMANLLGNKSMSLVARSKYVTALKQTGQLLATTTIRDPKSFMKPLRSIVTLALFEVGYALYIFFFIYNQTDHGQVAQTKGSKLTAGSANTHIHGAVARSQSILPVAHSPNGGVRRILQLLFSMAILAMPNHYICPASLTRHSLSPVK